MGRGGHESEMQNTLMRTMIDRWEELENPGGVQRFAREFDLSVAKVWNLYARLQEARRRDGGAAAPPTPRADGLYLAGVTGARLGAQTSGPIIPLGPIDRQASDRTHLKARATAERRQR